ncbi:MAG: thioredoxin domain-containing protein, partial [Myxococcaceae bacterium]
LEQASKYLRKLRDNMLRNPFAFGHLLLAADSYVDGAPEIAIVGPRAEAAPLLEIANHRYAPTYSVALHDPSSKIPDVLAATLTDRPLQNGKPAAYVCRHFSCDAPVTSARELEGKL